MFTEARYLTNEKGERLGIVVDPEQIESILKIHRQLTDISESLRESISELEESGTSFEDSGAGQRDLGRVEERLAELSERLEELEDLEASRVYYEAMNEIERGDDEPKLLREALPRIEQEREDLRRRGEL